MDSYFKNFYSIYCGGANEIMKQEEMLKLLNVALNTISEQIKEKMDEDHVKTLKMNSEWLQKQFEYVSLSPSGEKLLIEFLVLTPKEKYDWFVDSLNLQSANYVDNLTLFIETYGGDHDIANWVGKEVNDLKPANKFERFIETIQLNKENHMENLFLFADHYNEDPTIKKWVFNEIDKCVE